MLGQRGRCIQHRFCRYKVDFIGGSSDVAEVCIGHFSGAVDDTTHDGDGDAFEVVGFGTDALGDALEVKEVRPNWGRRQIRFW